jgi:single-stranded DNA-binding protein
MSLPVVSGKGFLLSDGVEIQASKSGVMYARLPLLFKNARRDDSGNWTHDKELKIEATVFGPLAEFLADNVTGRQEIAVVGELYTEEYTTKDGDTRTSVRMNVQAAAPVGKVREKVGATRAPVQDPDIPF